MGIDVAKDNLDVAGVPGRPTFRVANDAAGIEDLVSILAQVPGCIAVIEATGGYELSLVIALTAAGQPPAVVNPRQVREFARATGKLAKTDRIDAESLARFGAAMHLAPRPLPTLWAASFETSYAGVASWCNCSRQRRTGAASLEATWQRASGAVSTGSRPR